MPICICSQLHDRQLEQIAESELVDNEEDDE